MSATQGQTEIDWSQRGTPDGLQAICHHYYPWSQQLAELAIQRLPVQCDHDALRSAAGLALLQAVRQFAPDRGITFRTFATHRIRGAIIDAMRDEDHLSRTSRRLVKARIRAEADLLEQLSREPSINEVCQLLDWTREQYWTSLGAFVGTLEHKLGSDNDDTLAEVLALRPMQSSIERQREFEETMRGFELEERIIMYCYYYRGATLKQIGTVLAVSESRVSQLHSAIINRLKALPERFRES